MTITIPHRYQPRTYQLPLLRALDRGFTRAIIVWHRRSGKDKTCFNYMIKRAVNKVGTYFYLLPTFTQAKRVIWDNIDNDGFKMLDHIPKEIVKNTNATELKIELINGSIIQLLAADEFKKSGVGTNPIGVVFSEYSISDHEAWKYLSPILAANGGWAIFNYTPRGINHAHALLQMARDNDKWFTEVLTVNDTNVFTKEALEEERRNNPQDFFEQEYYCKFIEGAGAFFRRISENTWSGDMMPEHGKSYQIGADIAKYQDWTVLTPLDLHNFRVGNQERFNQMDYNLQKTKIESMVFRFNQGRLVMDSTGVGEPIFDDLNNRGLNVEPFRFTEKSRYDLLNNLRILLEQDRIKIPNDEGLINELRSFQYVLGETGKTKLQVPDGVHDDRVMSLALAVWNIGLPLGNVNKRGEEEISLYASDYK